MYRIYYTVPYEGTSVHHVSTLKEAKEWLKSRCSSYDYDLDNVDIIEVGKSYNPYDIAQGKFD